MGLVDGTHTKFSPDLPYMTVPEANHFNRVKGTLTIFRLGRCGVCNGDVPKSKKYCSKRCYERAQEDDDDGR